MKAVAYGWLTAAALLILSGCSDSEEPPGIVLPSTAVTPIISAASARQVKIGEAADIAVIFRAPTGLSARQLSITTGLSPLPAGWSTTNAGFTCDTVRSDDNCRLDLRFSPTLAGVSGTVNLGFRYIDANGVQQRGSADIPYGTTAPNVVTATVSPASPLQVGVGTSAQVTITFRSSDGSPASALTANWGALPAGWSLSASDLPCATVLDDASCGLSLQFRPTVPVGASMVSLPYHYTDSGGIVRDGTASIEYTAIDGGTVTATRSPTGLVDTYVGSTASVQVNFTATGGNVTGMRLTSTLPADWTVTSGTLPCPTLAVGVNCQATLTYSPTGPLLSGTVPISFTYIDSFGVTHSGSLVIPYRARDHYVYVPNRSGANVTRCLLDANSDPANCVNLTPTTLIFPTRITLEGGWAYLVDAGAREIFRCAVAADGGLSNCVSTGLQMPNSPAGIALHNGSAYVTDSNSGHLQRCVVDSDGLFSGCSITTLTAPTIATSIAFTGDTMYVGNAAASTVTRCTLLPDGTPTGCLSEPVAGMTGTSSLAISGASLYLTNNGNNNVLRCSINSDSSLSACADSGATSLNAPFGIALFGGYAYISNGNSNVLTRCTVGGGSLLTNCAVYAQPVLSSPGVLAVQ